MNVSLIEINQLISGHIIGLKETKVTALSSIEDCISGSLVFAESDKYLSLAENSLAAAIIVPSSIEHSRKPLIQVDKPMNAFIRLLEHFYPPTKYPIGIHQNTDIAASVQLGKNVSIAAGVSIGENCSIGDNVNILANAVIGRNVTIGDNNTIHPNVCIYDNVVIGDRVQIHAGSVLGADGFGYKFIEGKHRKIPHIGNVIIEDDVEIGANSMVDRATMGSTVIGKGTKIDNFVQIAHSVKIGQHNIICALTGIAGSTKTGDHVVCAANVGIGDHVTIGDRVTLGARTGIAPKKKIPQDSTWWGSPARPEKKAVEQVIFAKKLPQFNTDIKALKAKLKTLEEKFTALS